MGMVNKANYNKATANSVRAQSMKSTLSRFLPLFCHHLTGYLSQITSSFGGLVFFIYKRETMLRPTP